MIPVYNEGANVPPLFDALSRLPPSGEVLICYDFEGDDTLAAIRALAPERIPANLRLIRNTLGRGVRNAIESGMRSAKAPVVLVTMADCSDDYSRVEEMIELVERGVAVACGSRYMRGGQQIGGPRLKRALSRLAGWTLHLGAGIPTRDSTNSFKAYSREFLRRTSIESTAGFALGLELTVKAHFGGERVAEVPARWTDRSEGQSRFQLVKWLPLYLRWYLWAFRQRLSWSSDQIPVIL